jgi:hypothetical protein
MKPDRLGLSHEQGLGLVLMQTLFAARVMSSLLARFVSLR